LPPFEPPFLSPETKESLNSILASGLEAFLLLTPTGRFWKASPAALELLRGSETSIPGDLLELLFHPQDRERLLLWMRLASRQTPLWLPYRQTRLCLALLCRLDGGALLLAVHLEDTPGASGAGMNLDGARSRQAVEICGEDSQMPSQTEGIAALGQLVSNTAHELNNPLTGIIGHAQRLLTRGLNESQMTEAHKIYQEAERAREIVRNLLLLANGVRPRRIPPVWTKLSSAPCRFATTSLSWKESLWRLIWLSDLRSFLLIRISFSRRS
jgi:signal transduction histidine kinase